MNEMFYSEIINAENKFATNSKYPSFVLKDL